jgi:hypothetical protein
VSHAILYWRLEPASDAEDRPIAGGSRGMGLGFTHTP